MVLASQSDSIVTLRLVCLFQTKQTFCGFYAKLVYKDPWVRPRNQDHHMSSDVEESSYYSDEILEGVVEFLRVCEGIRSMFGSGRKFIQNNDHFDDWELDGDTFEEVDVALHEKYEDSEFVASVWAAILYEKPQILTLQETSGESEAYATIFKRTQAQLRLSIYIYAVLFYMDRGIFDTDADPNAAMPSLPSLGMLQDLKVDNDNELLCVYIGAMSGQGRGMTCAEIGEIVPASKIFFLDARPLAEVMLPLEADDEFELMDSNGKIPVRFQAIHAALLLKIDAHFYALFAAGRGSEYYTLENGPLMASNTYNDAMRVLPFKHAFCVPSLVHCGIFHHFWRRSFNYSTCASCKTVLHDGKWDYDRRKLM